MIKDIFVFKNYVKRYEIAAPMLIAMEFQDIPVLNLYAGTKCGKSIFFPRSLYFEREWTDNLNNKWEIDIIYD